jgi:F-type H+-transporting ATPase subunit c
MSNVDGMIAIASAIAVCTGAFAGLGIGIGTGKAAEAASRQPEATDKILKIAIIGFAFAEATAIYALLIAFMLSLKISV